MAKVLTFNRVDGVFDEVTVVDGTLKIQQPLAGPIDGNNRVFTTPDNFDPATICVLRNGNRQYRSGSGDFTVSEGGGPGTGYNTVTFAAGLVPLPPEILFADYVAA
jgi:hypothetical protein